MLFKGKKGMSKLMEIIIASIVFLLAGGIVIFGFYGIAKGGFGSASKAVCNNDAVGYCACLFNGDRCPSALNSNIEYNSLCCPPDYFPCTKANVNNLVAEAKEDKDKKYSQHSGQDWSFPKDEEKQKTWYGTNCRGNLLVGDKISRTAWKEYQLAPPGSTA